MFPKKCLKQWKCSICSICSILRGNVPCSIPFPYFPSGLNILNILNISPVLSTFLEHAPKRLNILSISPVLSTFWNWCFQKVPKTGEMFNMFNFLGAWEEIVHVQFRFPYFPLRIEHIEHIEHFPCFKHFFGNIPKKDWTYWTFPLF